MVVDGVSEDFGFVVIHVVGRKRGEHDSDDVRV